jgi:hypothetical protein
MNESGLKLVQVDVARPLKALENRGPLAVRG